MQQQIENLRKEVLSYGFQNQKDLDFFKKKYLGKSGLLTNLFAEFKMLSADEKKKIGGPLNELKNIIYSQLENEKKLTKFRYVDCGYWI